MAVSVLIVDDEKVSRDYIRGLINWEEHGYYLVGEAQSTSEAMDILANNDVNIVLLDVFMPGENGVVLSRYIAERYPSVAMIAISSYDNYDYVREILKNGAHDYILKHRLNGEVLLAALNTTSERMQRKLSNDGNSQFRRMVEAWLFKFGRDPFVDEPGKIVITIASVAWTKDTPNEVRTEIVKGIITLLEEASRPEQKIIAVYYPPNIFVICTIFKSAISEAKIQAELYLCNMRSKNNIKLVYNLEFTVSDSPILVDRSKIPEYVQKYIKGMAFPVVSPEGTSRKPITLTIEQQKQLFTVLDERNEHAAALLIKEIYNNISHSELGARMIITKELLEILMRAAQEYQVQMDFMLSGKKLFEWGQNKSVGELADKMIELYFKVIHATKSHGDFSDYVRRANEFIGKNYMHNIALDDVAEYVGVSSSYLSRLYREETGMTFVEYLNRVRVNAAKGYLNSGMAIKEVAMKCGFHRYNYFFKVFKDYEGVTPKEYINKKV